VNRHPNKFDVARKKILEWHDMADINLLSALLPAALSWVGNSLKDVYDILRKMPHMIQNTGKKRKAERIE
jgi:hypothetical protein